MCDKEIYFEIAWQSRRVGHAELTQILSYYWFLNSYWRNFNTTLVQAHWWPPWHKSPMYSFKSWKTTLFKQSKKVLIQQQNNFWSVYSFSIGACLSLLLLSRLLGGNYGRHVSDCFWHLTKPIPWWNVGAQYFVRMIFFFEQTSEK
jgi:hypothetical protein